MKNFNFKAALNLLNGAEILNRFQVNEYFVVLCKWSSSSAAPYVTWRLDEKGNAYWGHYHQELTAAEQDFTNRCKSCSSLVIP